MRARIDKDGTKNPVAIIDTVYTPEFFAALKKRFKFPALDSADAIAELELIGRKYIIIRRTENRAELHKAERNRYLRLKQDAERFTKVLESARKRDIAADMHFTALRLRSPAPKTEFPGLTEHQKQGGEPYFRELLRLMKLFDATAEEQFKFLAPRRGPKINDGLEFLVRKIADFFDFRLKRPLKIDHHKPSGYTEAFDFIQMLVTPLDNISDTEIVTAMRNQQIKLRKLMRGNPQK